MLWRAMTAVRDQTRLHGIILILVRYRFGGIVLRMGLAVSLMCFAAAPTWLIAPPGETARAGTPIMLDIAKPATQGDWPDIVRLRIVRDGRTLEVELDVVDLVSSRDARRTYHGVLPADVSGLVPVDLAGAQSNRLALMVTPADPIERIRSPLDSDAMPVSHYFHDKLISRYGALRFDKMAGGTKPARIRSKYSAR
jgi:hypothetical protein